MVAKPETLLILVTARVMKPDMLPEGSMGELVLRFFDVRAVFTCFVPCTCEKVSDIVHR